MPILKSDPSPTAFYSPLTPYTLLSLLSFMISGCGGSSSSSGPSSGNASDGLPALIISSAIGDLNGDGLNDIIVSNGQSVDQENAPRVYLNEGGGQSFLLKANAIPSQYHANHASAVDMHIQDLNADTHPDLLMITVAEDYQSSQIQLFLGNGDGTFTDATSQIANSLWPSDNSSLPCAQVVNSNNAGAFYLRVADVNQDTYPDFALSFGGISTCGGVIYLNNGNAHFTQASIQIQDLSSSTHTEKSLVANPSLYSTEILAGDLNGDGKMDFFAPRMADLTSYSNPTQVSYINTTSSSAQVSFQVVKSTFSTGVLHGALLDIDMDGKLDLVASKSYQGPDYQTLVPINAYRGGGDGTFSLSNTLFTTQPSVHLVRQFLTADLNQDGKKDLFLLNEGIDLSPFPGESSYLYLNNGSGKLENKTTLNFTTDTANTHQGALGDLDGDGDLDLIMNNSFQSLVSATKTPRIWINNGSGKFLSALPTFH